MNAGEGRTGRDFTAARQVGERRKKSGQRLACPGWRDQQRALACLGAGQQFELMGARLPALFREPADEGGRQSKAALGIDLVHGANVVEMRRIGSGVEDDAVRWVAGVAQQPPS